jgi:hypothetical protein
LRVNHQGKLERRLPCGERLYRFGSSVSVILILWVRLKSVTRVVGTEYARLNTGGSIMRGNSGNGVLPTLNGEKIGDKNIAPNDRPSCYRSLLRTCPVSAEAECIAIVC